MYVCTVRVRTEKMERCASAARARAADAHRSPQGYWCGYNRSSAAAPRGRPEFCLFTHACSILSLRSVILRSSVLICLGTHAVSTIFNNSDSFQLIFQRCAPSSSAQHTRKLCRERHISKTRVHRHVRHHHQPSTLREAASRGPRGESMIIDLTSP